MKSQFFVLVTILVLSLTYEVEAKKRPKKFGGRHHKEKLLKPDTTEDVEIIAMMEQDEAALTGGNVEQKNDNDILPIDPCYEKHCGPGKVCESEGGEARCICISSCPEEVDPRRKVCSNLNDTWGSDCALHQMRCWCQHDDSRCKSQELRHIHINYYGECREIEECTEGQMADFPRRMRDWLFNVMRDMADRDELSPYYLKMEQEAEANLTKRWTNAAVWKWCDLEKSHDRAVSRHELFPIRAHLVALEHCIAPFLDSCDVDNNHKITLKEWAKCLEINEEEIEDTCEDIRDNDDDST